MTKVINSASDLPKEFDISKYQPTSSFDLHQWASNVAYRVSEAHLTDEWRSMIADIPHAFEDVQGAHQMMLNKWLALVDDPIRPIEDPNHLAITGTLDDKSVTNVDMLDYVMFRPQWGDRLPDDPDPVDRYQRLFDVWDGREADDNPQVDRDDAYHTLTSTPYWQVIGARADGTNTISFNGGAMVKVNLHATDEKLAADFMLWLKETRAALGINGRQRSFKERDFDRWHRARVLAYFDLSFWAKLVGTKITDYAMGVALFPDDLDAANPAERVRQTVRPLADELFSVPVSTALASQAMGPVGI